MREKFPYGRLSGCSERGSTDDPGVVSKLRGGDDGDGPLALAEAVRGDVFTDGREQALTLAADAAAEEVISGARALTMSVMPAAMYSQ